MFAPYQSSTNVYKLGVCVISWIENHICIQKYCVRKLNDWVANDFILGFCIQSFDDAWKGAFFYVKIWQVSFNYLYFVWVFRLKVQLKYRTIWFLKIVHTDHGKVRALIRAALNERSLERYILSWLGDANGLNNYYESWALIRDNEASNLMPSIAAG